MLLSLYCFAPYVVIYTGVNVMSFFSKPDDIVHIPSTVVSDEKRHKAVKTRQEPKTKEQAQNVLEDDCVQMSAEILRFTV